MSPRQTIAFDGWVLRPDIGELTREDRRIRLQDQPLQILQELLAHPGELVTRDQLIRRLWPKGVVDFDTGLNSAIRKLRVALDDVTETPRYIETVPRKGYRFIGTIDPPGETRSGPAAAALERVIPDALRAEVPGAAPVVSQTSPPEPSHLLTRSRRHLYVGAAIAAIVIAGFAVTVARKDSAPTTQSVNSTLGEHTVAILPLRSNATDEVSQVLAQSVTELLRNRLAAVRDLVVIAGTSTAGLDDPGENIRTVGEKLHARFLLHGTATRAGDELRLEVQLIDAATASTLWSRVYNRARNDLAPVLNEIATRIAGSMNVPAAGLAGTSSAPIRIDLDAYDLYVRGQQLMANERVADVAPALELFRRSTILDPGFARGYLALGEAQWYAADSAEPDATRKLLAEAQQSIGRALELNPALGEAWILSAPFAEDAVKAEELFRKGLALAPSYGPGYALFSDFLFGQYRKGEAVEMLDRALEIDPRSPSLHVDKAFMLMVTSSDVAAHDRLLEEALAINPQFQPALYELATSRWEYAGRFAEAILISERAIALDPESSQNRRLAARIYLDLDDPVAATNVLLDETSSVSARVEIAQYQRDWQRAAQLSKEEQWIGGPVAAQAEAVRDEAIARGTFTDALKRMEARYGTSGARMWNRGLAMVYAHTLCLAGEIERGQKLASATMVQLDSESVGRTKDWFSRERASAFAVLGDNERTLAELAAVMRSKRVYRWWYLTDRDPLFAPLRKDPRFQALATQAGKHRSEQRALVDEMRRKGEIPDRSR